MTLRSSLLIKNRPAGGTFLLALGLAGAWGLLAASGALEPLERLAATALVRSRPVTGFHSPITVVAIDEASLARFGQMPWNRQVFARLLDRLASSGASVVGMDIAFNEPARDKKEDRALLAAMKKVPTVLPTFLAFADAGKDTLLAVEPLKSFAAAAVALGSIQLSTQQQAEVWQVEPYQMALGRLVPAFPVAVLGAFEGHAWRMKPQTFPWRNGAAWINFRGPAHTVSMISSTALYDGLVPKGLIAGRMVLLGATAPGLPDTNFEVPLSQKGPLSGVELQANVIDNANQDDFLKRLSLGALALLLALLACFPGYALSRGVAGAPSRGIWFVGAIAAWGLLATLAFHQGIWLETIPVIGFLASCYFAGLLVERTEMVHARNQLLGLYATDLANEAQRQRVRLEGELHDGIQQLLVVMGREVRQIQKLAPAEGLLKRLSRLYELSDEAVKEIKRLRGDLLPSALRHGGLLEALPFLAAETAKRLGIEVRITVTHWEPLAIERERELFWLIKEALNNAEKHAHARTIEIRLNQKNEIAIVEVSDDGCGFVPLDLEVAPTGLEHSGLHRLWLRMQGAGGNLHVRTGSNQGTCLRFSLPLELERIAP